MKRNKHWVLLVVLASALIVGFATPPQAWAASSANHVADVSLSSSGVEWVPTARNGGMALTVSTPTGEVIRREFAAGEHPFIGLFDAAGQRLADGVYQYELTAKPAHGTITRTEAEAQSHGETRTGGGAAGEVQSGSFAIAGGEVVPADLTEPTPGAGARRLVAPSGVQRVTAPDQVIADDLIVQGSACIGLDCVNNESFGFDTIRLKENNTRIKFDDTSTSTGFPNHDWQLTANDSASGGQNKFSIEDITAATVPFTVTGSAPTNSLFVDSSGRVGLRTSTPVLDLHIATGNTPAMRLEQNSSGGFTAQTWDIAGNEANFFVRDVTGGSRLPFRIRPGAPTSSIDIAASGNVGIGTASPSKKLTIKSSSGNDDVVQVIKSSDNTVLLRVFQTTGGDALMSLFGSTGLEAFRLTAVSGGRLAVGCNAPEHDLDLSDTPGAACNAGGARSFIDAGSTSFTASSSRTLKENLVPVRIDDILDRIAGVGVYRYDFINGPKDRIGLMAEDFHSVLDHGSDKLLAGQDVEMALWLAVQELTARNKELAAHNNALEQRLDRLEALLSRQAAKP